MFNHHTVEPIWLCPDIVVIKDKNKTIINISITFEGYQVAFIKARDAKILKYNQLYQILQGKGSSTSMSPLLEHLAPDTLPMRKLVLQVSKNMLNC